MIVVIILTSIVVGLAFSILSLVQNHMKSIQENFNKNTELNKLEQSLWIDFNRYPRIRYDALEASLVFASEIDSITYTFSTEIIIKDLDTFHIPSRQKIFFFNGNNVQKGPIDAIKLTTSKNFQNQELFVYKQNDATLFMN